MSQAPGQDLAEEDVEPALVQRFRLRPLGNLGLDQVIAEERRHHDRYDPRQDQGRRNDREQIFTKFRRRPIGKGDGDEAGASDERPRQHGLGCCLEGIAGRIDAVHALLQLDGHHFDGNDGVVDEEAQGDDEGPQGDFMQVDAGYFHDAEDAGQDQRDTESDDQARPQSQAEEADDEDDDDSFAQGIGKIADRLFDDLRLVRYLVDFHACRQIGFDAFLQFLQVFTELQVIAAALHGQGDADGRFAVVEHLRVCRFRIAPFDRGDVTQAEDAAIGIDRQVADGFDVFKDTGQAQVDVIRLSIDHTGRRHLVLAFDGIGNGRRRNAQFGQFGISHFDIDLFRLFADQFDFAHIVDGHHHAAYLFGLLAQFFIRITIAGDGIDRTVDVIEAVVIIRAVDAFRQVPLHVFRQIADFMPRAADTVARRLVVEIDVDDRLAGPGITLDIVQVRRILQFLFDLIRNLFLHLFCRSSGPGDGNDHGPHRIRRVFHTSQFHVGKDAGNGDEDDEVPDEDAVMNRDFR